MEGCDMQDGVLGALALLVGGLLCFRGYAALRTVIAVWGGFTGFFLGAGLVAGVTGDGFLSSALAWGLGLVLAVGFGLFAYLYYALSVVVGMGAIGFALGTTAMVALGMSWSWLVVLVGVAVAVLLAGAAIAADLPLMLLALLSAFAGSTTILAGVMLLTGVLDSAGLADPATTGALQLGWWWTAAYIALAVAGLAAQLRSADARRQTLRQAWDAEDVHQVSAMRPIG
jgi:hypothetical protein